MLGWINELIIRSIDWMSFSLTYILQMTGQNITEDRKHHNFVWQIHRKSQRNKYSGIRIIERLELDHLSLLLLVSTQLKVLTSLDGKLLLIFTCYTFHLQYNLLCCFSLSNKIKNFRNISIVALTSVLCDFGKQINRSTGIHSSFWWWRPIKYKKSLLVHSLKSMRYKWSAW